MNGEAGHCPDGRGEPRLGPAKTDTSAAGRMLRWAGLETARHTRPQGSYGSAESIVWEGHLPILTLRTSGFALCKARSAFRSLDSATWSGLNMERSGILKLRNKQLRGSPARPGL